MIERLFERVRIKTLLITINISRSELLLLLIAAWLFKDVPRAGKYKWMYLLLKFVGDDMFK